MRARIHRGCHEIGGNCVEVESAGARIVLDLGRPLDAPANESLPLPPIRGLDGKDRSLLALLISHPHQDHYGLATGVSRKLPVFIGKAANDILAEAAFFGAAGLRLAPTGFLEDRVPFGVGPFRITPFLVDHSAFDSYSLLVEAGGRRLFYTGDLRATGRKGRLFQRLLRNPPRDVDALLMEGTLIRKHGTPERGCATETEVEAACAQTMRQTSALVLAYYSAQNIDRLVTIYRAALKSDRDFVVDLYTASMAKATGSPNIPGPGHRRLQVFVPHNQRLQILRSKAFDRMDEIRDRRIYLEGIAAKPGGFVVTVRGTAQRELAKARALGGAQAIWSLWGGYLRAPSGHETVDFWKREQIPWVIHHTSGHAAVSDLRRLVDAIRPRQVVPMHSEATERFTEYFSNVVCYEDGELWDV
jgi:ribonuclease J